MVAAKFGAGLFVCLLWLAGGAASAQSLAQGTGPSPQGNLFSAIPLADTELAATWGRLRMQAVSLFPGLRLSDPRDLHITIVYIGAWKPGDLERIRQFSQVLPDAALSMKPALARLGQGGRVVALELHAKDAAWAQAVVAAKTQLNQLGLKQADPYDSNFRAHITLADGGRPPLSDAMLLALNAFEVWMAARLREETSAFTLTLDAKTKVQLLLAGVNRPDSSPAYVPVEQWLSH